MKYEEITAFLNKLIEKTKKKKIIWEEDTFQRAIFKYNFNNGIVIIKKSYLKNEISEYSIKIINNTGRIVFHYLNNAFDVDTIVLDDTEIKLFTTLTELYECAYKQYYNIEETIEGMLKELDDEDLDI